MIVANDFRRGDSGGWHVHDTAFQPDQPTSRVEGLRGEGLLAVQGFTNRGLLTAPMPLMTATALSVIFARLRVSLTARFPEHAQTARHDPE